MKKLRFHGGVNEFINRNLLLSRQACTIFILNDVPVCAFIIHTWTVLSKWCPHILSTHEMSRGRAGGGRGTATWRLEFMHVTLAETLPSIYLNIDYIKSCCTVSALYVLDCNYIVSAKTFKCSCFALRDLRLQVETAVHYLDVRTEFPKNSSFQCKTEN